MTTLPPPQMKSKFTTVENGVERIGSRVEVKLDGVGRTTYIY